LAAMQELGPKKAQLLEQPKRVDATIKWDAKA
jgi:hypothetical protein